MSITTVHLVFKTHLDVGFTDLAKNVIRQYFGHFIPGALDLANAMRERGGAERFIWTTGSWLVFEYLEQASSAERQRMEWAIRQGDIAWHGLPFTTQSEAMTPALFAYGLSLSRRLDARYGRRTVAAKMTDVPGHTRAIIPLMVDAGLRCLNIGVNPASTAPDVPPAFLWRSPEGAEIIVLYSAGSYGTLHTIDGLDDALFIAHTNDNLGPPSVDDVLGIFDWVRQQFPGAEVRASTLDAFTSRLETVRQTLPVVTSEIGDTWIHGLGTDPKKVSQYRELLRLRDAWIEKGVSPEARDAFDRRLLLVPEHTWGMDVKTFLGDYANYAPADLARARIRDKVDTHAMPAGCASYRRHAKPDNTYRRLESSWQEQRDYIAQAVTGLMDAALIDEAESCLREIAPRIPDTAGFSDFDRSETLTTASFAVAFDPATGSIIRLEDRTTGHIWCTPANTLGLFRYESFSQADYDRRIRDYGVNLEETAIWAIPDFSKPGMDAVQPHPEHRFCVPQLVAARQRRAGNDLHVVLELLMPESCTRRLGAPRKLTIEYRFTAQTITCRLQWFDKQANRLPEALWFSFNPRVTNPVAWMMDKMGQSISPLDVVRDGARNLHAVQRGVENDDDTARISIESLDAPLVSPGTPRLLHFDNTQPQLEHGMHFNLYNNIWGTNFPMWYEDDATFRFVLTMS